VLFDGLEPAAVVGREKQPMPGGAGNARHEGMRAELSLLYSR